MGVNCGRDLTPADCADIIRAYAAETGVPLFARPNAGPPSATPPVRPGLVELPPDRFAREVMEVVMAGVRMVGGCCGTTPAHIAELARLILPASERR